MFQRVLTAVLGIPLLVFVIDKGGLLLFLTLLIVNTVGLYEYTHAVNLDDNIDVNILLELSLGVLLIYTFNVGENYIIPCLVLSLMSIFIRQVLVNRVNIIEGIYAFFGLFYVTTLLGHILLFENFENGNLVLWLVFIISFSTDTFAYIIGVKFGKHKLSPSISPKKSIEGAVGGIVGSVALTCTYGYIMSRLNLLSFDAAFYIVLSFVGSIISQFGDLTASILKRTFNVKDFGRILPGHGGILDRLDSIIYVTPMVYYLTLFYLNF